MEETSVSEGHSPEPYARQDNPYFEIITLGHFVEGQISVKQNPPDKYSKEQDEAIERVWDETNAARLEKNLKELRETPQLKFKSASIEDEVLQLEVTDGTYKDHAAVQNEDFRELFPDFDPKIIGTNIVVRTSDNRLMIVQRGLDSATKPGAMSVVGGQWDITKDCDEKGVWDPFKTITRELEEETGIKRDEIDNLAVTGIIHNKTANNPSLIFYADSILSSEEIKQRVGDGEVTVKFIDDEKKKIESAILWWASSPSPSGSSALSIYGREKFGQEWLDWINRRINRRYSKIYSILSPEQLTSIDNKAARALSRKD